jgi:hypothetical protein
MNDTPTNPEPKTRQEDPPKKTVMGPGEIEKFDNLLIRALFADNIKPHASDAEKERVFGEIRAVCLTRGLTQFTEDFSDADGSFVDVMTSYGANVASYMQTVLDNLHDADQKGNATTPGEQALLQFFKERGVRPRPLWNNDRFLNELRKFAMAKGIPDSTFDELVAMVDEDEAIEEDEGGCDCSYHRVQHAMRDAVQEHCQRIVEQDGNDGYSIVCPDHGRVFLTDKAYTEQLLDPDRGWFCTECGVKAPLYEEEDHGE